MPNQDLTITEGKVVGWSKKVGDQVTKGETVAEIETDKAVIAIEAPADGRLVEIVAPVEHRGQAGRDDRHRRACLNLEPANRG